MQLDQFIHQYGLHTGHAEDNTYRQQAEAWYDAACCMTQMPEETQLFLSVLRKAQKKKTRDSDIVITVPGAARTLLRRLQDHNLLTILLETRDTIICFIPGGDQRAFLSGDWLKIYLWRQLTHSGRFDDVRWSLRLVLHAQMEYELDVLCLHEDTLFLYECNTMADPIAKSSIYLDLIAIYKKIFQPAPFYAHFVAIHPQLSDVPHYDSLLTRARQEEVHILAGHELGQLTRWLPACLLEQYTEKDLVEGEM